MKSMTAFHIAFALLVVTLLAMPLVAQQQSQGPRTPVMAALQIPSSPPSEPHIPPDSPSDVQRPPTADRNSDSASGSTNPGVNAAYPEQALPTSLLIIGLVLGGGAGYVLGTRRTVATTQERRDRVA